MKKTVPLIAAIALIFAVGAVIAMKPVRHAEPPPSPPPATKFQSAVGAVGLVEANSENIDLSCAVSGMVTGVYVKAGDRVQAGQKLFSLDDRDLQADLGVSARHLKQREHASRSSKNNRARKTSRRQRHGCARRRRI